ncbi:MAG TPA: hypothetical protein DCX27_07750, partial [Balneola sp.]|nr:hypothetical protein [Balneola sp.]
PYCVSDIIKDKDKFKKQIKLKSGEHKALYRMQRIVNIMLSDWATYSDKQKNNTMEILKANAEIAMDYFENPLDEK